MPDPIDVIARIQFCDQVASRRWHSDEASHEQKTLRGQLSSSVRPPPWDQDRHRVRHRGELTSKQMPLLVLNVAGRVDLKAERLADLDDVLVRENGRGEYSVWIPSLFEAQHEEVSHRSPGFVPLAPDGDAFDVEIRSLVGRQRAGQGLAPQFAPIDVLRVSEFLDHPESDLARAALVLPVRFPAIEQGGVFA